MSEPKRIILTRYPFMYATYAVCETTEPTLEDIHQCRVAMEQEANDCGITLDRIAQEIADEWLQLNGYESFADAFPHKMLASGQ